MSKKSTFKSTPKSLSLLAPSPRMQEVETDRNADLAAKSRQMEMQRIQLMEEKERNNIERKRKKLLVNKSF